MIGRGTSSGRKTGASGLALCALLLTSLSAGAAAQDARDAGDGAVDLSGHATFVGGIADGDAAADADVSLRAEATTILESGLELGAGGALRVDGDRPYRTYAGGRYSSPLIGGTRGIGPQDGDLFVEGAYLFARGGFGSLTVGRDDGAASRLAVTSPSIFRSVRVGDWRTDLTGLNDVHVVNDFSGTSAKVTYMPPPGLFGGVIGNVQLGLSYAPRLGECEGDACAPLGGYAPAPFGLQSFGDAEAERAARQALGEQAWRDVVEAAVYYQRGIDVSDTPLRVGVGASYVRAAEDEAAPQTIEIADALGDYRAYALGLNVAYGNLTVGGSVKSTNTGIGEPDGDYLAFDAGVTYEVGDWNFMLGYGAADAERDAGLLVAAPTVGPLPRALDRRTQTAQAGVSKALSEGVTLGVAAQFVDADRPAALGGEEDAAAVVLESSFKF